ncbi:MAG: sugar ABC transporter substrate-binding protein [Planctomycetes bacterium]|nr:sugar ABC transporter substrate-binding protein [Planctomycetota bacterium]
MKLVYRVLALLLVLTWAAGCRRSGSATQPASGKRPTVGVAFETLQTEYWVASLDAVKAELDKRGMDILTAVADGDANRQLEQVNSFIARRVDGIILVPKDAQTVIPMIRAANRAQVPIVLYNRPPAESDAKSVTVVADNRAITRETVTFMAEQAKKRGGRHKAAILIGDLGDINAVGRRDGFDEAIKHYAEVIEVVARIPTEWNQEKALAGLTNALQANPDINFIFTSSDFLLPSIASALKTAGKYKKIGEEGHVLLGGFDGDATAYRMLVEGYLDADGVQDVYFECAAAVQALVDLRAGKDVPPMIYDPGLVIQQGNLSQAASRMWGANVKK